MKIVFSSIVNNSIFDDDFTHLTDSNGTIEFKHLQGSGGIAVVYAPNGTGKTSLANLLERVQSDDCYSFTAADENGNQIIPESAFFHIIKDQLNRNIIRGKTTDYLIGQQIRREYELNDRINTLFTDAIERLSLKYKTEYKVTKVGDYFLRRTQSQCDRIHKAAYAMIRSIVNAKQRGRDIDLNKFVAFLRNGTNIHVMTDYEEEKRTFIISDSATQHLAEKIIAIDPSEIVADENIVLVDRHDDAISILMKYHSLDSCIVCDNHTFDGDEILERKKVSRKHIYENLDGKTKDILENIVHDSSLSGSDPFRIRNIVGSFIADGNPEYLINLQRELQAYVDSICNEMINALFHCFDGTCFFEDYNEHAILAARMPQLDNEELLFIENVINDNIGKDISIVRDEASGKNYKLMIGGKDLLGIDRKNMELSTGEQNFISLAFELLLARHSNKEYVVIDDPISSLDSVYKNKLSYCIVKFLENKKQIILTHNTDLIRLLDVQCYNCFNLYILGNAHDGINGFIPVDGREKELLINLHNLVSLFQNKNRLLLPSIHNRKQFLMSMIPFMRGYAHISLDPEDYYGQLSNIMHGYGTGSLDVVPIYNKLFGEVFEGSEIISVSDILQINFNDIDIFDRAHFPLLTDTLEQTLAYYHLRMKVEKELVELFEVRTDDEPMLNQIIMRAFNCQNTDPDFEAKRKFRVFFTSRKTLLNEFNHFEGNMNIFQPAIDISKTALQREITQIDAILLEARTFASR